MNTQTVSADDLLLFCQVVEWGSLSRAGEQLAIPKATVSRRLANLEATIGERLLQRTTRKMALTDMGSALLAHAKNMQVEWEAVGALRERRQSTPSGLLRVSMPQDFASLLLIDMLSSFTQKYPSIRLELDLSPRRIDIIGEGFDLALRIGELPYDGLLVAKRIASFEWKLFASPSYIKAKGHLNHPDDLWAHDTLRLRNPNGEAAIWTLIHHSEKTTDNNHKKLTSKPTLKKQKPIANIKHSPPITGLVSPTRWQGSPPSRVIANSPEVLLSMAKQGLGIAAAPSFVGKIAVEKGDLINVLPDWQPPVITAWAILPSNRLISAKTKAFINMLEEKIGA